MDPLKLVIVREGEAPGRLWLTGFDAPCCHTMYVDKPMAGHNLMQAIARRSERDFTAETQRSQRSAKLDSLKQFYFLRPLAAFAPWR